MLKIIMLEDEAQAAERVMTLFSRFRQTHPEARDAFTIKHYDDPVIFLTEYRCDADLLLLDIQMPGMTGMETAKKIRKIDPDVMIIFITSLTQYAVEGYSVNAFDYILKPLHPAAFEAKMERAFRVLNRNRSGDALTISTKEQKRRVPLLDILYIEVNNHDILVHTEDQTFKQWGTMNSIESELAGAPFVRCSVHYLVNLRYVQGVSGDDVILPGTRLPISRSRRKEFLNAIAQYEGGGF
jgi:DNA-binding LytR/AlgR family response regulator